MENVTTWDEKFNSWLKDRGARPIGLYSVRFTVKALKDETTIIQDFRLRDRNCPDGVANAIDDIKRKMHGTLVHPPAVGGPGEDVKRDVLGFQVSQYGETRARIIEPGYPKLGVVAQRTEMEVLFRHRFSSKAVTLEQGDARTFDMYFVSELDCTFGLEMNVTAGNEDTWIPVNISPAWSEGEGAAIAGPESEYDTLARPKADGPGMELARNATGQGAVPRLNITVDDVTT
ncbi:hypothetical protein [Streptomyces sp. NEAU-W12]|uniref:hypothetical protein n=1 Tax=Streptomyces sp. NEAU-W12 TaxID=2994668 RepID=UPI00224B834A|nr:hypothetical protein [Streptomyces sp. NEAU-W12]MCX2926673.1 hypothetical protein [Streptomyces sp. NEAU-W12]